MKKVLKSKVAYDSILGCFPFFPSREFCIFVAIFWHPIESAGQIPTDGMQMLDNIKLKHSYINL